jgi:maltose/moltooligosaccharide transporter
MPNSPALWVAAGMLWIMDASINISMEPFRAFVGDMLPDEQRTTGFAMQSFFIGIGAVIASALPYVMTNWFHIQNKADPGIIPDSVKFSFYIGGIVFLAAVLWTVIRTREYSPEQIEAFERNDSVKASEAKIHQEGYTKKIRYVRNSILWMLAGGIITYIIYSAKLEKELYVLSVGFFGFGIIQLITGLFMKKGEQNGLVEVMEDLFHMPRTMGQLAFVQFFSWFALFAMWIYTTPGVTDHIYGTTDTTTVLYNEGANWVGILMAVYNGFAALMAFLLPVIARMTNRRITHLIALSCGGLGLISFFFIKNPHYLILSEIGIGFAWASILAMPYAILTGSLPAKKMGVYMGIFNYFIVIPQILAASILGALVRHLFDGKAIYALVLGGASMILAGILTLFVTDRKG